MPYYNEKREREIPSLSLLEAPEEVEDPAEIEIFDENVRCYLDGLFRQPIAPNIIPIVTTVNRLRFIQIIGVIEAAVPYMSVHWPRHPKAQAAKRIMIAENDNH